LGVRRQIGGQERADWENFWAAAASNNHKDIIAIAFISMSFVYFLKNIWV